MSIRIAGGGTPNYSQESLCRNCRNVQITRGQKVGDDIVLCHAGNGMESRRITFPVTFCTSFDDKRTPPMWELEKIAWRVSPDLHNRRAGFNPNDKAVLSPEDYKKKFPDAD